MKVRPFFLAALMLPATALSSLAVTAEEAGKAIDAAASAEAQAGQIRNQWTSTEAELAAARKGFQAKDYDAASAHAALAAAMAHRSMEQAKEQDGAWAAAVIK